MWHGTKQLGFRLGSRLQANKFGLLKTAFIFELPSFLSKINRLPHVICCGVFFVKRFSCMLD